MWRKQKRPCVSLYLCIIEHSYSICCQHLLYSACEVPQFTESLQTSSSTTAMLINLQPVIWEVPHLSTMLLRNTWRCVHIVPLCTFQSTM